MNTSKSLKQKYYSESNVQSFSSALRVSHCSWDAYDSTKSWKNAFSSFDSQRQQYLLPKPQSSKRLLQVIINTQGKLAKLKGEQFFPLQIDHGNLQEPM